MTPDGFRDRLPWYLAAIVLAVLLALIGASVANYVAVAQVHVKTSFYPSYSVAYPSTPAIAAFTLHLAVDNPSSHVLYYNTIGYKVWVEDLPAEAGLVPSRTGLDVPGPNRTLFFSVFVGSIQVPPSPVPAGENVTYLYTLNLTAGSNAYAYGVVGNITAFARTHFGTVFAIRWIFWTSLTLDIGGVPQPASYSPADYLLNLGRVAFEGGQDLGGG